MEKNPWLVPLTALLAIIAGLYLIGELWALSARFSDIILLFFLAWLLAFVLNPLAAALQRRLRFPRAAAVGVVYVVLILLIIAGTVLFIPVITLQLAQLSERLSFLGEELPLWTASAQAELNRRNIYLDLAGLYKPTDIPSQLGQLGALVIQNGLNIVTGIASAMFAIILVLVISFYFMVDDGHLLHKLLRAAPTGVGSEIESLMNTVERSFGGFIRGQAIQAVIYGVGTAVIMLGAGVGYVLVSSMFAGIMMLIPFFGPFLAIIPPLAVAGLQGSLGTVIVVGVALFILQQLVINVVAPKVLSEAVGLPPLLVILALLLGAKLAGIVGSLFGVPIVAILYTTLLSLYRRSELGRQALARDRQAARADDTPVSAVPTMAGQVDA